MSPILTDLVHEGIYCQEWRVTQTFEVLPGVLDGVWALDVLGWRLEDAFGEMLGVRHVSSTAEVEVRERS